MDAKRARRELADRFKSEERVDLTEGEKAFIELFAACEDHGERKVRLTRAKIELQDAEAAFNAASLRLEQAENRMAAAVAEARAKRVGEAVPILSVPDTRG